MITFLKISAFLTLAPLFLPALASGEAKITQAADKSVSVTTPIYSASIDASGNLVKLSVKGARFATQNFTPLPDTTSKTPATFDKVSITVTNHLVTVRRGNARTEWTFGEDAIDVVTESFNFEFQIDPTVKLALIKDAGAASLAGGEFADDHVIGVVLGNDLSVVASADGRPYGFAIRRYRMFPAIYNNGFGKLGQETHFSLQLGAPATAIQFLSVLQCKPVGDSMDVLREGGNEGQGIIHFAAGIPIAFATVQQNRGSHEAITLEYRCAVYDHYIWGLPWLAGNPVDPKVEASHRVFEQKRSLTAPAGGEVTETWAIPHEVAGFYYLFISVWQGNHKLTELVEPFCVDLPHYVPKTTRPADFDSFWAAREQSLKDTPLNPQLKKLTPDDSAAQLWEITGDMPGGKKFDALLEVPVNWDGRNTLLSGVIPSDFDATIQAVATGKWESKAKMMSLTVEMPEAATYCRWNSALDNNLLDNVLLWLRAVDYLKTRPEVKPRSIRVFGASRSGPLALMTAAMRAGDIAAVSAHVHTSCGISSTDKPYFGWGVPNQHNPKDIAAVAKLAAMSAYVDPVNHAEKIICPITFGYGASDFMLSPPEGIEAAYVLTKSAWKRISRDAGEHQYSAGMKKINGELDDLLGAQPGEQDQNQAMKKH